MRKKKLKRKLAEVEALNNAQRRETYDLRQQNRCLQELATLPVKNERALNLTADSLYETVVQLQARIKELEGEVQNLEEQLTQERMIK
jgi:DNA repair exonuclease SbcCD ATPase subunit